jgi:deoxyribodipyrimidine photo-lyase
MNVVWLKRDLRVSDHRPLAEACARGDVLVLYVVEPALVAQPETDPSHVAFLAQGLAGLRTSLRALGGELVVRYGAVTEVFETLHRERPFSALFSHEETGNGLTYERDKQVARWCRERGVPWHEYPQTGVVRRLKSRDGWAKRWDERMHAPLVATPKVIPFVKWTSLDPGAIPDEARVGLPASTKTGVQRGGVREARETLDSFLRGRGIDYARSMSSPVTAWEGCSRLSVALAHGHLSMREVIHAVEARRRELVDDRSEEARRWRWSLQTFDARLRWHCHFMQKLEDEPAIEFENFNRAMDGLREDDFDEARFQAWARGETGYPMVDACMRALLATGWINFRMRAMLVSFASYDLWLHWRRTGLHLARHFLDFEAGIHWSQMQMQSGTTGINTLRIYSPAKQVEDHDPKGTFIRQWVPEIEGVPDGFLAEPWTMPPLVQRAAGCVIGRDYPAPIVDHKQAVAEARRRLAVFRNTVEARAAAAQVMQRHGSRRRPTATRGKPAGSA